MVSSELDRERDYVATLYARLDELRADAQQQLKRVHAQDVGGNHQSRSERDAFARIFEDRIVQLNEVDERLAFGRLEAAGPAATATDAAAADAADDDAAGADGAAGADPRYRYIGRIGLRDDDLRPILLDWRVPQAGPFYQATAATPMGIRSRRHLLSRGRRIVRIEDEIFDSSSITDDEASTLQGEGALMASLSAERTGRMHDIVATIQAEQDRIIRSELPGVLVVQGGPGTGKTAVALHRAAYLLYSHRERLRSSGVLVVGPSRAFLQYIEAVLPSLGETGVVLASVGQLYPGIDATAEDRPEVAVVKGDVSMASLVERAIRSRQRVPDAPQQLDVNGEALTLEPSVIANAIARAHESRKPYNEARVTFVKTALAELTRTLAAQLRSHGNTVDEDDYGMLREDLRSAYDVRVALNTAWIPLTPQKLLQDLYARPQWLAELTPNWSPARRALLRRDREAPFTVSDVPLLDEAAEHLGEHSERNASVQREAKQQRKRDIENAENAIRNMDVEGIIRAEDLADSFAEQASRATTAERAASDRTWTYGHIVVDEAQELSPMQWRLLRRRGPLRSFTIVGDIAQASAAASAHSWAEAVAPLVGRAKQGEGWRLEELTVNYRTPTQIADAAQLMAEQHDLPVTRSTSVRESEWPITTVRASEGRGPADRAAQGERALPGDRALQDALQQATLEAVEADRSIDSLGTIGVIVLPDALRATFDTLTAALPGEVGVGAAGLTRQVAVMTPQEAKGLEFDSVVIVEPDRVLTDLPRGASALYVAMTRPTQRLTFVSL
ncbi:HelD family protein [Subtercola boreus]|uniref:AAA family ATPase n=1 Tax=Subtercola boreus TaxID=120213 RepID=A0A3E0WD49_9MICO|nr:UvrD-helicase domain-containing protein [Subtercola boreus]RFA20623.1 AAA family ATPase [Subtercola boreus]RFA20737.1 AAA family ATPase [Subtercola boreus]RFA26948.1 AAA family ATPase [Subtercola boreus]